MINKNQYSIKSISKCDDPSTPGLFLVFYVDEYKRPISVQVEADSLESALVNVISSTMEREGIVAEELTTVIFAIKIPSYTVTVTSKT